MVWARQYGTEMSVRLDAIVTFGIDVVNNPISVGSDYSRYEVFVHDGALALS